MNTNLRRRSLLVACTVLGPIALGSNQGAWACAAMPEEGTRATITDEAAVIVWDAKTKTEHFIRRATFDASDSPHEMRNIGFLVPTPSMPDIAAADTEIFDQLESATKARVEVRTQTGFKVGWMLAPSYDPEAAESDGADLPPAGAPGAPGAPEAPAPSVQVQKTVRVGDYTATVLSARDTASLSRWLKKNNYQTNPSINAWLAPYVSKGWKITAFKVDNKHENVIFDLTPVRLSFKTDKPYYPYREPASARAKGNFASSRALRIFYVGGERVAGDIGRVAANKWPAETQWASTLPKAEQAVLRDNGIPQTALANTRMTVFRDTSSPRPGTDEVFFRPAKDQAQVVLPPIVKEIDRRILIPFELILVGIIGVSLGAMKLANAIAERPRGASQ